MARGLDIYEEAKHQGRLLTPRKCAKLLKSDLVLWYNADYLTIDSSGLVSGAEDLTGNGIDGTQTTAGDRLTYYPNDPTHNLRPSFGSSTRIGDARIDMGEFALIAGNEYYMTANYRDGVDSTFDYFSFFISGPSAYGVPRIMGASGTDAFYSASGTLAYKVGKNGNTPLSGTVLPLPTSVCRLVDGIYNGSGARYLFGSANTSGRVWEGTCRNVVITSGSLGSFKHQLIEGVLAWDSGIGLDLISGHPFNSRPPMIGD